MSHKYSLKKDKQDSRDKKYSRRFLLRASIPSSIDLRPDMPPIVDQGQLGSCTANAIAGAVGYLEVKNREVFSPLSRLFVYYNERDMEGTIDEDSGAMIRDGIKSLAKYGVCHEYIWPYDITNFKNKPSDDAYTEAIDHKVTLYKRVSSLADMKSVLAEGYPIVIGVDVFQGFEDEDVTKTGIVPMPSDNEEALGGHAILVVGYDDKKKWFIIRNSWGTTVGDKGHYYLSYDYITKYASDMWVVYNEGKIGRFTTALKRFVKSKIKY